MKKPVELPLEEEDSRVLIKACIGKADMLSFIFDMLQEDESKMTSFTWRALKSMSNTITLELTETIRRMDAGEVLNDR